MLLSLIYLVVELTSAAPLVNWQPTVTDCIENWITQDRDHFSFGEGGNPGKFQQRYFTFKDFYRPGGPLFFYVGNEGPVEIYVNHTGLMWELGSDLGAFLVFAEHRYYGKTQVYSDGTPDCLRYLTIEQALADYSVMINTYTRIASSLIATIAFGGSYGGMLASAFRYKYPHIIDGAIAASAPIFAIGGVTPEPSKTAFNEIITRDAGPVCAQRWCDNSSHLNSSDLANQMVAWATAPWAYLAMGNFPFPSNYITAAMNVGGGADLPAHPVRVACEPFERLDTMPTKKEGAHIRALAESLSIYYNASGELACNSFAETDGGGAPIPEGSCKGDYGFQTCTEMPWGQDSGTDRDMFWPPSEFDPDDYKAECLQKYGVTTKAWAGLQFLRNMADALASMSNVFFSNGKFDPWGVSASEDQIPQGVDCTVMYCPKSVASFVMETGAHHSDLMFTRDEVN
ncbi:Dipeptidyl-peptidase 2 precursor, putative [Perkinsus marinus ATCC 50983]|uniref:Dipeptidyl-peptidase 2, putative n=1 Tax=Perkinsus marinus (strain ATCC 50983 / TXsc) TaxID=423536 RepID=C5LM31_PERM5|nr:Dipeptidyl-peptidase 2 precursor, putative [Perkinsus marinus ATCC 50983]EER02216.1 Dipeptidyl-peptidase 2 precursor, putative [Perkinsus marinus ATCC 50983]|eukprot:XP_002769498.1 Dipeptidyl-peptidase 2 precursor, putative [Perkinsus marinus ATCC 50983]